MQKNFSIVLNSTQTNLSVLLWQLGFLGETVEIIFRKNIKNFSTLTDVPITEQYLQDNFEKQAYKKYSFKLQIVNAVASQL